MTPEALLYTGGALCAVAGLSRSGFIIRLLILIVGITLISTGIEA